MIEPATLPPVHEEPGDTERLCRITRLARRSLDVSMASVAVSDRQWIGTAAGFEVVHSPPADSFCSQVFHERDPLVVPDARLDERFRSSALVAAPPYMRFCAGVAFARDKSKAVGSLMVFDNRPRQPSPDELETLRDLGSLAETELRLSRLSKSRFELQSELGTAQKRATTDFLTRIWNRETILLILQRELIRCARHRHSLAVVMADIDNFKRVNDTHGHPAGDAVLKEAVARFRSSARPYDSLGRYGGDEFLLVLIESDSQTACRVTDRIRIRFSSTPVKTAQGDIWITTSLGISLYSGQDKPNPEQLIASADKALYRAKDAGRNRTVLFAP